VARRAAVLMGASNAPRHKSVITALVIKMSTSVKAVTMQR
jgi:hypothetical protein